MELPVLDIAADFDDNVLYSIVDNESGDLTNSPTLSKSRKPDPDDDEEDDDYDETYGDLEDGHDDLTDPESGRGVDNLE